MASSHPGQPKSRAETQRDINAFALFMFAWEVAYSHPSDTLVFPVIEDVEGMARYAIRHFLHTGQEGADGFQPFLDATLRALHARYFFMHPDVKGYAMDEVRSLIAEELGFAPDGTALQSLT